MDELRKEHDLLIATLQEHPNDMDSRIKLMKCNRALAGKTAEAGGPDYLISKLAQEVLEWGPLLIEMGLGGMNVVYCATSDMEKVLDKRPRLKAKIMELQLEVLNRQECMTGHSLNITDDLRDELYDLRNKISRADNGDCDSPEWSPRWEEVIDEAEEKAYSRADDEAGRRTALAEILATDYGIR